MATCRKPRVNCDNIILIIISAGSLPCFSPFTLLRTAAEAAVRSKYLIEPGLTHEQRLGRALNKRLETCGSRTR